MFNLKNQEANTPYGNLSADDILANIRKRLGISEEPSHNQGAQPHFGQQHQKPNVQVNQQPTPASQQVVNIHQPQGNAQPTPSNSASFDDDFSLNMDFSLPEEIENKSGSNVNKAYRAYQNAMKSSYQQETNDSDEEELSEDFDSELGEWNPEDNSQENAQENEYESEDFIDEEELSEDFADEEELSEDFDTELGDWNPEEDDYDQSDYPSQENQQESNVHFLNTPGNNTNPSYGFGQIALNIETMFAKIVQEQVQGWCNENLENVCRNIIKEELYKEKTESNRQ